MTTSQFFRKETENPVVKEVRDSDASQKENIQIANRSQKDVKLH